MYTSLQMMCPASKWWLTVNKPMIINCFISLSNLFISLRFQQYLPTCQSVWDSFSLDLICCVCQRPVVHLTDSVASVECMLLLLCLRQPYLLPPISKEKKMCSFLNSLLYTPIPLSIVVLTTTSLLQCNTHEEVLHFLPLVLELTAAGRGQHPKHRKALDIVLKKKHLSLMLLIRCDAAHVNIS